MHDYINDPRFAGLTPLKKRVFLATPTRHENGLRYVKEAYESGWITTVGDNITELEKAAARKVGVRHAVGLVNGTSAIHLAVKLAAERVYHSSSGIAAPDGLGSGGALYRRRVFCSDMTFGATVNPVLYEGGEPVFIDTEYDTWNMDPAALERAFEMYPDVRIAVLAHLYGTPAKAGEIKRICESHKALLIEDAAESFGAAAGTRQTGSFGDYGVLSFNGNKIITGSSGGMLLVDNEEEADKARKWSAQSREAAPWYEHEELGYNYRMSNIVAGIVRDQLDYLDEHIAAKRRIFERYESGLKGLPVEMNPGMENTAPNYWLSCMIIEPDAMCETQRSGRSAVFKSERGKSCPTEILEALDAFNAEGRPIWKPLHLQPIYRNNGFVTRPDAYIKGRGADAGQDIFNRGLCLPSDIKMTAQQQEVIIDVIHRCFR